MLRGVIEQPQAGSPDGRCVVVVPGFGRTMRDCLPVALFLRHNGFQSLRFDFTHHVGISEGAVYNFSASSAVEDLRCVLSMLPMLSVSPPVGMIASSLGARIALRATRGRDDVAALISLLGVVDAGKTLARALEEDVVTEYLDHRISSDREVLGYDVGGAFTRDLVDHRLHTLESTASDVESCHFPITQICAERDAWSDLDDSEAVFDADRGHHVYVLRGASHKLEYNPTSARTALRVAVSVLAREMQLRRLAPSEVRCPTFGEIVDTNRGELAWERNGGPPGPITGNGVPSTEHRRTMAGQLAN